MTVHLEFFNLLRQVNSSFFDLHYPQAEIQIKVFSQKYGSSLFFTNPLLFYEFLSLRGLLLAKMAEKQKALEIYNQVLKFNPFHVQTLQRKLSILHQDQSQYDSLFTQLSLLKLQSGNKKIFLSKDSLITDQQMSEQASIAHIAQMNTSFSNLRSIQRFGLENTRRKSVLFKQLSQGLNQDTTILIKILQNPTQKSNEKPKSILKKSISLQVNVLRGKNLNRIQGQPQAQKILYEKVKNQEDQLQLTQFQKKLSFDVRKVKSIDENLTSKSNQNQSSKKMISFQVSQLQENSENLTLPRINSSIHEPTQVKQKKMVAKRKSSLAQQSKFIKIPKYLDMGLNL